MSIFETRKHVEAIRSRIEELKGERSRVMSLPADRATIESRIDALIAEAARSAPVFFEGLFGERSTFTAQHFNSCVAGNRVFSADVIIGRLGDPLGFLAVAMPEALKAAALARMPTGGLTDEQRAAAIAKVNADLEREEVAEEIALREIEDITGGHERRRLDARGDILAAFDADLAKAAGGGKGRRGFFGRAA